MCKKTRDWVHVGNWYDEIEVLKAQEHIFGEHEISVAYHS